MWRIEAASKTCSQMQLDDHLQNQLQGIQLKNCEVVLMESYNTSIQISRNLVKQQQHQKCNKPENKDIDEDAIKIDMNKRKTCNFEMSGRMSDDRQVARQFSQIRSGIEFWLLWSFNHIFSVAGPLESKPRWPAPHGAPKDLPPLCGRKKGSSRGLPSLHGEHCSHPDCPCPILLHLQVYGLVPNWQFGGNHSHGTVGNAGGCPEE